MTEGVHLRLLLDGLQLLGLNRMESRAEPIVLYFHPWELDPDQPRLARSFGPKSYHYAWLTLTAVRLRRPFNTFSFGKLAESGLAATTTYTVAVVDGPSGTKTAFEAATAASEK